MATKFSPCKGSYVLNQFPSNVMFGMNGFHLSASGAIQGHHGPLVLVGQEIITNMDHADFIDSQSDVVFRYVLSHFLTEDKIGDLSILKCPSCLYLPFPKQ